MCNEYEIKEFLNYNFVYLKRISLVTSTVKSRSLDEKEPRNSGWVLLANNDFPSALARAEALCSFGAVM